MFISSSKARERLTSDKNRLSSNHPASHTSHDSQLPSGDRQDPPSASEVPAADPTSDSNRSDTNRNDDVEEEIVEDTEPPDHFPENPSLDDMRNILTASSQEILDFQKLDSIIAGEYEDRVGKGHGVRKFRNNIEAQEAIGEVAALTTQQTAADLFGISQAQAHAYDNAASSSNHAARREHKPDLKKRLDSFRELLATKAAIRLHETLDVLDGDKLRSVKKATNLSRIAKDMATVMRNVEERLDRSTSESTVYHIFRPQMREESSYEVVEAGIVKSSDGGEDLPKI